MKGDTVAKNGEAAEIKPTITIVFEGEHSSRVNMTVDNANTIQLWGAAAMIKQYADDLWLEGKIRQAQDQAAADAIAKLPQDHKRKGKLTAVRSDA